MMMRLDADGERMNDLYGTADPHHQIIKINSTFGKVLVFIQIHYLYIFLKVRMKQNPKPPQNVANFIPENKKGGKTGLRWLYPLLQNCTPSFVQAPAPLVYKHTSSCVDLC